MKQKQFKQELEKLISTYFEDGLLSEKEIRDCFETVLTTQIANQNAKAENANISVTTNSALPADPEMEAYVEKAFQAMRRTGRKMPKKERFEIPLKIMYLIHKGEYATYFKLIEDIAEPLCGVKTYHGAELRIVGPKFANLYTGLRYLLNAYIKAWYKSNYVGWNKEQVWRMTGHLGRFEFLENVEDALYKDMKAFETK